MFSVPHDCDIGGPAIDEETAESMLSENENPVSDSDMGFGMSMSQVGSNFFVMGDYVRPDRDFIDLSTFQSCFNDDNQINSSDNLNVRNMKQKDQYDCVMQRELDRKNSVEVSEPGPM